MTDECHPPEISNRQAGVASGWGWLGGCGLEDAVDAGDTNSKVFGDALFAMARCQQCSNAVCLGPCRRLCALVATFGQWQGFVLGLRGFDADTLAYKHLVTLELGNAGEDVQHKRARGGRRVDVHVQDADGCALVGQCLGDVHHVCDVACCTVNLGDGHDIASLQAIHQGSPLGTGFHVGGRYLLREQTVTACLGQLCDLVFKSVLLVKSGRSGVSVVHGGQSFLSMGALEW